MIAVAGEMIDKLQPGQGLPGNHLLLGKKCAKKPPCDCFDC